MSRNDLIGVVDLPIIGDINHIKGIQDKEQEFLVMDRSVIGEQFRILRTNLSLLLKKKEKQVVLVTSSISGEGKSFLSKNLAAVLAIPGKRVALLEFDLRKWNESDDNNKVGRGLSNYLQEETTLLSDIYTVSKELPSLHIYGSGPVSSNPGDLMLNNNVTHLINTLKQQYDYVIIDSAPVGLVSDAFTLGEYSDVVLYVIRQRVSEKKQLDYLNDIVANEKFTNIALVLNDVKSGGKFGYYGFGYGIEYGNYLGVKNS